jgi:hypothetical protein
MTTIEDSITALNKIVDVGKVSKSGTELKPPGALVELTEKISDIYELGLIHEQEEADRLVTCVKQVKKAVDTSLRAATAAAKRLREDEAATSGPQEWMLQCEQYASGAFLAMNTQAKLLEETEKKLAGKWKDKPLEQQLSLLRKDLARTRAGLDSHEIKRQRREFEKNRQAHASEVNATGGADPVHEEEGAAAPDADADSDDEFGGNNLVEEGVRRVFATKGAAAAAAVV